MSRLAPVSPKAIDRPPARAWPIAAFVLLALITGLGLAVPGFGTANFALVFLLPVVVAASGGGRRSGILFAGLAGAAFNFVALEPRLTLHIARAPDLMTLAVYALVALLTASVAVRLVEAKERARADAANSAALTGLAQRLITVHDRAAAMDVATDAISALLGKDCTCNLSECVDRLPVAGPMDDGAARWAAAHRDVAGRGSPILGTASAFYASSRAGHRLLLMRLDADCPAAPTLTLLRTMLDDTADTLDRLDLLSREADDRQRLAAQHMRDALFASIGHDLRTPLARLRAGIDALDGAPADGLAAVRKDALRLEQTLLNLLELARVQSMQELPAAEVIDLTDTVAAAVDALPAEVRGRVRVSIAPGTPLVVSNAVMMHHITMNLIDNAAKYSPPDTDIEVHVAEADANLVLLSVKDRGTGLHGSDGHGDDDVRDLFALFRRGTNADRASGSGVGLAVVDAFARALGHRVTVSPSMDGNGSVFAVAMPAHRAS